MITTKTTQFLAQLDNLDLVDLARKYAQKQVELVLGNGVALKSANKPKQDYYDEFAGDNKVADFFYDILFNAKIHGVAIATIAETNNGDLDIDMALPGYNNEVSKIYHETQTAVVYKKPIEDDLGSVVIEHWTKTDVRRRLLRNGEIVSLMGLKDKTGKEIKPYWKHNLGFLPVWIYKNKPLRNFTLGATNSLSYQFLKMDAHVQYIKDAYNLAFRTAIEADIMEIPRIFATLSPQSIRQLKTKGGALGIIYNKVFISSYRTDKNGQGANVNIEQPTFNGNIRQEHLDLLERKYAEGCGSSFQKQEGNIQTATEVFYTNALDEKTANQDLRQIERFGYKVLDSLFTAKGLQDDENPKERDYTFEALGNKVLSEKDKSEIGIAQHQAGLLTIQETLMYIFGISKEEADTRAKDLEAEADKNMERGTDLMAKFDASSGGNQEGNQEENRGNIEGDKNNNDTKE